MSEPIDKYYRILELNQDASKEDIKRAYRRLALKYHPDKNRGNEKWASTIFIEINKAYSVLIDSHHVGETFESVDDARDYFKKNFYDLARRIDSEDSIIDKIYQEECDFFFRYQLEEVSCVKRSIIEARRIIDLIRKATLKGYDTTRILVEYSEFFQKYGFSSQPKYNGYEELIAEYKKIIEVEPGNANVHCSLGVIYEKCGMIDAAISEYKIASYIDPGNTSVRRAIDRLRNTRRESFVFGESHE